MDWKRIEKDIQAFDRFYFNAIMIVFAGATFFAMFVLPFYLHFHIDEEVRYKCFKYIDHEHCDFPLFRELEDLKEFSAEFPASCNDKNEIQEAEGRLVKNETIKVELLEENTDSGYVKVKYRDFILKKEYYTLKCFVKRYAPEDFTF